jgi:hypothetical protein
LHTAKKTLSLSLSLSLSLKVKDLRDLSLNFCFLFLKEASSTHALTLILQTKQFQCAHLQHFLVHIFMIHSGLSNGEENL